MCISDTIKAQVMAQTAALQQITPEQLKESKPYFDFERFLQKIEVSLQKINPLYRVAVVHTLDDKGVIIQSVGRVDYDNATIFSADTSISYLRYDGSKIFKEENAKQYFARGAKLEETVFFKTYPPRYFEVVEEKITTAVVKNEIENHKREFGEKLKQSLSMASI